jgi:uncharacterized damage-inducible protein DinB
MKKIEWFRRKFGQHNDNGTLPGIVERLAGTPARLEEKIRDIDPWKFELKDGEKWSIKEEIGHLLDLEPLWSGRLDDFINGKTELRSADLKNRKTHDANHNDRPIEFLLADFRKERKKLIEKVYQIDDANNLDNTSLHPRLKMPMKVIDLAYFVAEHDDHHLAQITFLAS